MKTKDIRFFRYELRGEITSTYVHVMDTSEIMPWIDELNANSDGIHYFKFDRMLSRCEVIDYLYECKLGVKKAYKAYKWRASRNLTRNLRYYINEYKKLNAQYDSLMNIYHKYYM